MANNIVLIGGKNITLGGSHLRGITEELEDRIINKISLFDSNIERVEIIDLASRDMQPIDLSWIGASVLAKLESIEVFLINLRNYGFIDIDGSQLKSLIYKKKKKMRKKRKKNKEVK